MAKYVIKKGQLYTKTTKAPKQKTTMWERMANEINKRQQIAKAHNPTIHFEHEHWTAKDVKYALAGEADFIGTKAYRTSTKFEQYWSDKVVRDQLPDYQNEKGEWRRDYGFSDKQSKLLLSVAGKEYEEAFGVKIDKNRLRYDKDYRDDIFSWMETIAAGQGLLISQFFYGSL